MQRPAGDRADLWLEQRRHEERVIGQFNRLNTSVVSPCGNPKAVLRESIGIRWRDPIVAPVEADERCGATKIMHSCTRDCRDASLLADKTAGKAVNDPLVSTRSGFTMFGSRDAGHVSGELNDRILETTTGAQKRLSRGSGGFDRGVHRGIITVGCSRDRPQPICFSGA